MWFRIWRPDYFYLGRSTLIDACDGSPFNRGWSLGFGFFVLTARWNEGRTQSSDGIHYPVKPRRVVVINGETRALAVDVVSHGLIAALAGYPAGATVTYLDRLEDRKGTLQPGQSVYLSEGMIFDAVPTSCA